MLKNPNSSAWMAWDWKMSIYRSKLEQRSSDMLGNFLYFFYI